MRRPELALVFFFVLFCVTDACLLKLLCSVLVF